MEATHFLDQLNWTDGEIENSEILSIDGLEEHIKINSGLSLGYIVAIFKIRFK